MKSGVSVIIPAYNQAQFLPAAIDGALHQTHAPLEVIVVDDGSTDDTQRVLFSYGERIRAVSQNNAGVAAARNAGIQLSQGDFLAFLDSDDVWLPRKLERQLACFGSDPKIGLAHCGFCDIDAEGNALEQHLDGMEGDVAREMLLFRRPVILGGGSGVMVSRAAVEAVGNFDERLSTSADWDFYRRVAGRFKVAFVREVLLYYRLHGANMHRNVQAMEHDLLIGYAKAFEGEEARSDALYREAYGNLHMMLAGSYFAAGQKKEFLRHAGQSLRFAPGNSSRLLSTLR